MNEFGLLGRIIEIKKTGIVVEIPREFSYDLCVRDRDRLEIYMPQSVMDKTLTNEDMVFVKGQIIQGKNSPALVARKVIRLKR